MRHVVKICCTGVRHLSQKW